MQILEPHLVRQTQDYISPFARIDGFRTHWWQDHFLNTIDPDHLPYTFTDATGAEAARALLREHAGADTVRHAVDLPPEAIAIEFVDVRKDLRTPARTGVGTRVVRLLEQLQPDTPLFAFAEGETAAMFWQSVGWTAIPRLDGDTSYRPLFVVHHTATSPDAS